MKQCVHRQDIWRSWKATSKFIEETSHNICKSEIRLYVHVLIVNLNCLWNKSGYRYTPVYMYIIYIILVCPCLEEKEICWRFLLQGGRSRPHLTREIKKKLNSFYIIIKYAYQ